MKLSAPSLLNAARALALDGVLDKSEVELLAGLSEVNSVELATLLAPYEDRLEPAAKRVLLTLSSSTEQKRSALSQVVALRATARLAPLHVDVHAPVDRAQLQSLVGAELFKVLAVSGETLSAFFDNVADKHFASPDAPITYRDFRQALLDLGLDHAFTALFDRLPKVLLDRAKAGASTPRELCAAWAELRADWQTREVPVEHTTIVGRLAQAGRVDELLEARALMSDSEIAALESGHLSPAEVACLMADAQSRNVDVVIIGAGMAGLAAAEQLMVEGKRVVVLEAKDKVGGRTEVDTETFGGHAFDVGAAWLHAAAENPLTPITTSLGFSAPLDDAPGLAVDGQGDPRANMTAFKQAANKVSEAWSAVDGDEAAGAHTPDAGPWTGAAAGMLGPLHMGRDPKDISTKDFAGQAEEHGDRFVKEGFGAVVASFGHGVPVRLKTAVAKVSHTADGAEVKTWGGKTYRAKTVLCTASTNVMAQGKIAFDPPLPEWKKAAFENVPLASFNKIALQFDDDARFGGAADGAHVRDLSSAEDAMEFVVRPTGVPVVVGMIGGSFSRALTEQGEAAMIEHALCRLEKMFGSEVREHFVKGRVTDWDQDPFALGSFSCAKPGYADARADIEKPTGKTLYFAGEAGDELWAGCVPGAYLSGQRAAKKITERLEKASARLQKKRAS